MRDSSPSPPPTPDLATPSAQVEPLLLAPNGGGLGAGRPLRPSTTSSQPTSKPWFSIATLQSRYPELTNLGSKVPQLKPLDHGFEGPSFLCIATLARLHLVLGGRIRPRVLSQDRSATPRGSE